jgi:putative serine/threonine protein kinase
MKYYSKGKRGKIYLDKEYIIKKAEHIRIKNEVKWLKILNKYNIGPKLIKYGKDYFKYKFIKGNFIIDFIEKNNKKEIKKVLLNVLKQCRIMDKLKVNKKEMHNPFKHIIINKKVNMIDFERCYKTNKPKNVTQFSQFIMSNNLKNLLIKKKFKIDKKKLLEKLIKYKHEQDDENFKSILKLILKF